MGFSVSGEFKSVILLPLSFNILADNLGRFKTASRFGQRVWVDLFSKGDESSFSCFSILLKDVLKSLKSRAESLHMIEIVAISSRATKSVPLTFLPPLKISPIGS